MGEARRRRLVGDVAIWKTPVGAVEEVDRIQALSRAAEATIVIETDSVDAYWASPCRGKTVAGWDERVKKLAALMTGDAHLRLPDGTCWIHSCGILLQSDGIHEGAGDNRFLQRLVALLLRHERLRKHSGSHLPPIMIRQDTLDPQRVFCKDCGAWCDLLADAEEADRLESGRRERRRNST
jgi:hypothetical protein